MQLQGEQTNTVRRIGLNPSSPLKSSFGPLPTPNTTNAIKVNGRSFISTAFPVTTHELEALAEKAPKAQFQYRGLFGTITTIARQEGPRSLYNGLSAGLQRQMVFASVRLGLYDSVKGTYQKLLNEKPDGLHVFARVMAGLTTGAMAVIVGQPTEVVKIKFQAQKRMPGKVLQFTSTPATYRKIGIEDGVRGLWKGAMPNIGRNAIVNVSEIVCYDIVKDCLMFYGKMRDNIYCHFTAAVIAGKLQLRRLLSVLMTYLIMTILTIVWLCLFNFHVHSTYRILCNGCCITG